MPAPSPDPLFVRARAARELIAQSKIDPWLALSYVIAPTAALAALEQLGPSIESRGVSGVDRKELVPATRQSSGGLAARE